ncbi:MAG: hypothetical protein ACH34U_13815 [Cyanobium sp.]
MLADREQFVLDADAQQEWERSLTGPLLLDVTPGSQPERSRPLRHQSGA